MLVSLGSMEGAGTGRVGGDSLRLGISLAGSLSPSLLVSEGRGRGCEGCSTVTSPLEPSEFEGRRVEHSGRVVVNPPSWLSMLSSAETSPVNSVGLSQSSTITVIVVELTLTLAPSIAIVDFVQLQMLLHTISVSLINIHTQLRRTCT